MVGFLCHGNKTHSCRLVIKIISVPDQVMFESPIEGRYIEFSTEPNIVPNTFGYEDCIGEECEGVLK